MKLRDNMKAEFEAMGRQNAARDHDFDDGGIAGETACWFESAGMGRCGQSREFHADAIRLEARPVE